MRLFANRALVQAARQHYEQPHRDYHNGEHLDELIALARVYMPHLDEPEQLALLFHDAVYVPGAPKGDNEKLSALLMRATAPALSLIGINLDKAARIIVATMHVEPPPPEAARVCDLDLWRLAAPWEQFRRHTLGILRENRHLYANEEAFWTARGAFLQSMLAKPSIFATDDFRSRFEETARANMTRSLSER